LIYAFNLVLLALFGAEHKVYTNLDTASKSCFQHEKRAVSGIKYGMIKLKLFNKPNLISHL